MKDDETARGVRGGGRAHPKPRRAVYDSFAAHYDRVMSPLERRFMSRLRARTIAALPATGRLLELGAGTGANFARYPPDALAVAIEPSREMLRRAREKNDGGRVRLLQADAEHLPFGAATFDSALATLVFCSIRSPPAAFAELRRVVRPGGTIALLEHVRPEGRLGPIFDVLSRLTVKVFDDHFNRRTAEEARRAGLQVTGVERHARGVVQIIVCRV